HKAVLALFKTQQGSESDSDEESDTIAAAAATDVSAKPKPFNFKTPEGIKEFIAWTLQKHPGGTMAFHWRQWGDGIEKKIQGFFLSYLIVYTYAYHLAIIKSIPARYARSELPPSGALLLSIQAVERELGFWKTGTYVVPKLSSSQFSFDNWGDIKVRDNSQRSQINLTRRATKFLATLKAWTPENWEEVEVEAEEWLEVKKRFASSSCGTSEAEDTDVFEEDEPEFIIVSD
ncbi:hypothetical protein B0H13DRAFT_1899594, partial [Mycena leptocephala]